MIILFEKNEKEFNTLGLGVLKDSISCIVTEDLNGGFELEMEYPITGNHYSDISLKRIILAIPNMYDQPQPFRIYSITKPINGRVIINAEHISYDMSGYIVKPFNGTDLIDTLNKIQNGGFPNSPFILSTNKLVLTEMKTDKPYNQRALLAGQSGSLLDIYGGEYKFDRFNVHLLNNRGQDRGVTIRYGKNLIDLENKDSSSKIYTGIFPFYSATINETTSITEKYYQSVYIVDESVAFAGNWLSLSNGGKALIPLIENVPVQIKTEGIYYDAVCYFLRAKAQDGNLIDCYIRPEGTIFESDWLSLTNEGPALIPSEKQIFKILTEGEYSQKTYIWNGTNYVDFSGTGFYYIYPPEETPPPPLIRIMSGTEEKEVYIDLTEDPEFINGMVPVPGQELADPQKILNLDLTDKFTEEPTIEEVKITALDYIQDTNLQEITTSLSISFIKVSDTEEYKYLKDLEIVQLGDRIGVYYEDLGITSKLQVISTEFNVLSERYDEIKLGTKSATLTDTAITTGDGVSSLTNDKNYADNIAVVNIMAQNLTADYITGKNAKLTEAQIEQLKTERIEVAGLIEASEGYFDALMAQLLVAENAEIKNKLISGEIEVKGKIIATSGEITAEIKIGKNEDGTYNFSVDQYGNAKANSLEITGGSIRLGDSDFLVDDNGNAKANSLEITGGSIRLGQNNGVYNFSVDNSGSIIATALNFHESGEVTEESSNIEVSTTITDGKITTNALNFDSKTRLLLEEDPLYQFHTIKFDIEATIDNIPKRDSFVNVSSGNWSYPILVGDNIYFGQKSDTLTDISNITSIGRFNISSNTGTRITVPEGLWANPILVGNDIYFSTGDNTIGKLNTITQIGTIISVTGGHYVHPILVGDTIYYGGNATSGIRKFHIPTQTGSIISLPSTSGIPWSFPVLVGNDIYFGGTGSGNTIGKFNILTQTGVRVTVSSGFWNRGIYLNGYIYFDCYYTGNYTSLGIFNIDTQIGTRRSVSAGIWQEGVLVGTDIYYFGDITNVWSTSIKRFNTLTQTGSTISVPEGKWSNPILIGSNIYVGYGINNYGHSTSIGIFDLQTRTGKRLTVDYGYWNYPVYKDGFLYFGKTFEAGASTTISKYDITQEITSNISLKYYDEEGNELENQSVFTDQELTVQYNLSKTSYNMIETTKHTIPEYTTDSIQFKFKVLSIDTNSVSIYNHVPTAISESEGNAGISLNSNFLPRQDGGRNLGSESKRWEELYAINGVINTSDKKDKKDISYDLTIYQNLFDNLKPASFKFIKGSSGRTHLGLISQDLEKALLESNLTSQDFAGFIKSLKQKSKLKPEDELTEDDYSYGIRYSELHAMEINEIQKLKKEVEELKQLIKNKEV